MFLLFICSDSSLSAGFSRLNRDAAPFFSLCETSSRLSGAVRPRRNWPAGPWWRRPAGLPALEAWAEVWRQRWARGCRGGGHREARRPPRRSSAVPGTWPDPAAWWVRRTAAATRGSSGTKAPYPGNTEREQAQHHLLYGDLFGLAIF